MTVYALGGGAFLAWLTWDARGTSRRRLDPVDASVMTEYHLDRVGWLLMVLVAATALVGAVLPWRWWAFVDTAGVTRLRPGSRLTIAWAEVTAVRIFVDRHGWRLSVDTAAEHISLRLPFLRRTDRVIAVQRALDAAGSGVDVGLPFIGAWTLLSMRQFVYDLEVATGRRPATDPRPRLTRRDVRIAIVVTAMLAAITIPVTLLVVSRAEQREATRSASPPTIDVGSLAGTREPDLSTLDGTARATAVRALADLGAATRSIDCDGPIPTEGGLPAVRYVSVRSADGLWESTPEFAPNAVSTSWRLADLAASGAFATTGPLPERDDRWEVKIHTTTGPAWFGCTPAG